MPVASQDLTKALEQLHAIDSTIFTLWAIIFIAASAVLALAGSVLSLLRKNTWGGALGLLATAVIAFSNAYPFNALSAFYLGLHSQTESLRSECQLKQPFTTTAYEAESLQLQLLIQAEGKRPGCGNYKVPTDDVTQNIERVKAAANTIATENALLLAKAQDATDKLVITQGSMAKARKQNP